MEKRTAKPPRKCARIKKSEFFKKSAVSFGDNSLGENRTSWDSKTIKFHIQMETLSIFKYNQH